MPIQRSTSLSRLIIILNSRRGENGLKGGKAWHPKKVQSTVLATLGPKKNREVIFTKNETDIFVQYDKPFSKLIGSKPPTAPDISKNVYN